MAGVVSLRNAVRSIISSNRSRNTGTAALYGAGMQVGKQATQYLTKPNKNKRKRTKSVGYQGNEQNPSQYKSKIRKDRKRADFKKKRPIKVTRRERAKIKKVVNGNYPSGFYHEIYTQKMGLNGNQQNVQLLPVNSVVDTLPGHLFSPTQILDAASILWNNKTPSSTKTVGDALNFNPENAIIKIKNCNAVVKMKNQSQRLLNVCVYTCDPKSSQDTTIDLQEAWINELTNMSTTGPIPTGSNVLDNSINTLYNTPKMLKGMRANYKISKDYYEMFPGQEVNFNVQGPSYTTLDMQKCYRGATYNNLDKKFSRQIIMTVHGDMTTDDVAPNNVGRGPMPIGPSGLITEVNLKYLLYQPEQAGWYNPTGGIGSIAGTVPLEMRRSAFAINNLSTAIVASSQRQVLENGPEVFLTNPS